MPAPIFATPGDFISRIGALRAAALFAGVTAAALKAAAAGEIAADDPDAARQAAREAAARIESALAEAAGEITMSLGEQYRAPLSADSKEQLAFIAMDIALLRLHSDSASELVKMHAGEARKRLRAIASGAISLSFDPAAAPPAADAAKVTRPAPQTGAETLDRYAMPGPW